MLFYFRAVGWACVVAIVVVSLVPGDARPDTGLPGQIDHIIAYCGAAGLLGLGYPATKSRFGTIVMLISLAATLEVAQRWIPGRHPQFIDFAASVAGTSLGMLAAMVVHRIALCHRCKVMTLTPSRRAISLCNFPCVARSFACASFVAISTLECLFLLAIAACIRPSLCC